MRLEFVVIISILRIWYILSVFGYVEEALDSKVWKSTATVYFDEGDEFDPTRPFLCHFKDVFIDPVTVFFKAWKIYIGKTTTLMQTRVAILTITNLLFRV